MKRTYAFGRSGFGCPRASGRSGLHNRCASALLLAAALFARQAVFAQTGQNAVIHDTGNHTTNSPSFFDATQFPGADPCVQINATFTDASFPKTGGTVDARGLVPPGVSNPTLICSVNPIPSGAKGRLLLSSGTYLAQVPWVIQSNNFSIIGTGASGDTGNNNTIIQACASGQANCGGMVFPSGNALIQMGTSAQTVMRSEVKELAVDCQDVPGVSGFQAVNAQEQTVVDLVRATGCRVAAFDIGVGDTNVQNGVALSNFDVGYPPNGSGGGQGCPPVTAGSISGATRSSNGTVTAILSVAPNPPLVVGNEVVIAGFSNATFNGTYRVLSFSSPAFTYQTSTAGGTTLGIGLVSPYPVGVRVWQVSSSAVRPIINGTINGSNCASFPPIAMELSGGSPFVQNVHTEGFAVGVQIGDLSGTNGATLTNLKLNHNTTTGIVISNQWATAGGAPGALPTENVNIFNLDVTGGPGTQTTQSIIDNLNGNTLTNPTGGGGNGTVGYYLFGLNGVTTSAKPESGLVNAFDINGQTAAIYSGSASPVFSAAPSGAGTGAVSTSHYVGVQATGPSCFFTSGGGINSGCTLDAGSTDSVGTIIATTGNSPGASGTITLTFNSNLGTNRPSCVFMASDKGGTAWSALAVMKDKSPGVGSDVFTWTNGTGSTNLAASTPYWINYFCGGR